MFIYLLIAVIISLLSEGECNVNIALKKVMKDCASQPLHRLTDGRHDTSETIRSTCGSPGVWVQIEFGSRYIINYVVIIEAPCIRKGMFFYQVSLDGGMMCNRFVDRATQCTTIRMNCKNQTKGSNKAAVKYGEKGPLTVAEIEFYSIGRRLSSAGPIIYRGCYREFKALLTAPLESLQGCKSNCAKMGFLYFAIESRAAECSCGNDYDEGTVIHDVKCDMLCHPDISECRPAYTVYLLRAQLPSRQGCYAMELSSPENYPGIASATNPIEKCLLLCDNNLYALIRNFTCTCKDDIPLTGIDQFKRCRENCGSLGPCSVETHFLAFKTCYDGKNDKTRCTKLFKNCEGDWKYNGLCMTRCRPGYMGDNCLDKIPTVCDSYPCDMKKAMCVEEPGEGYRCKCRPGYFNANKTSCVKASCAFCDKTTSTCVTKPIISCKCKPGFVKIDNFTCREKAFCAKNPCDPESSTCEESRDGYRCKCRKGFKKLNDNNKCIHGKPLCPLQPCNPRNSFCRETANWFYCICMTGYLVGDDESCVEESLYCNPRCEPRSSTCVTNLEGDYECKCRADYHLQGTQCIKSEHCEPNPCGGKPHTRCVNAGRTYKCQCVDGFYTPDDDDFCIDIDECDFGPCSPSRSECVNHEGYFTCDCKPGFVRVLDDNCRVDDNSTVESYLEILNEYYPVMYLIFVPIVSLVTMVTMRMSLHYARSPKIRKSKNFGKNADADEMESEEEDDEDND